MLLEMRYVTLLALLALASPALAQYTICEGESECGRDQEKNQQACCLLGDLYARFLDFVTDRLVRGTTVPSTCPEVADTTRLARLQRGISHSARRVMPPREIPSASDDSRRPPFSLRSPRGTQIVLPGPDWRSAGMIDSMMSAMKMMVSAVDRKFERPIPHHR